MRNNYGIIKETKMNTKIENFLLELRNLTNSDFVITEYTWAYTHKDTLHSYYTISSLLNGFKSITKDTKEELIDSFDLIREQIHLLMKANKIQEQLQCKLLKNTD